MPSTPSVTPPCIPSVPVVPIMLGRVAHPLFLSDSGTSSITMLAASFLPVYSLNSPCEGIWVFDGFISADEDITIGVGDAIQVYHCHFLSSLSPPFPPPAFCGHISHISGWSHTHIAFTVQICASAASPCVSHRRTIYVPTATARLSWWQSLWGTLIPLPRCITLDHRPPFTLTWKQLAPSAIGDKWLARPKPSRLEF
ncbi:hypothetical protein C8R48DRAFT_780458 [Suillus tomentosus]|nr:hypothetical protein C8R48DRAFT_780458 [Suillus tomentosus]